jgi:hypothetical protein
MKNKFLIFIGSLAAITAGLIHIFIVALAHGAVLPHLIAFITGGILQIMLGIFIWFESFVKHTFWAKSIVHGGFIFMLVFSVFLPVPFLGTTEALSDLGIITIAIQLTAILCLMPMFLQKTKLTLIKAVIASFMIALIAGGSAFALGHWGESMFPGMKATMGAHGGHHGNTQTENANVMDHHDMTNNSQDPMMDHHEEMEELLENMQDHGSNMMNDSENIKEQKQVDNITEPVSDNQKKVGIMPMDNHQEDLGGHGH